MNRQRHAAPPPHPAFTLLELMIVMAIIAIVFALVAPAITTTAPRQAAILGLKSALEAGRAEAIRNQTEVYVAFTDNTPQDPDYQYSHYALFSRERRSGETAATDKYFSSQLANLGHDEDDDGLDDITLKQIRGWSRLPDGIVFGLAEHVEGLDFTVLEPNQDPAVIYKRQFPVTPEISGSSSTSGNPTMLLPFFMFNEDGRLRYPQFFEPERQFICLVEGWMEGTGSSATHFIKGMMANPDGSGTEVPRSSVLGINLYSGRVRIISQNN